MQTGRLNMRGIRGVLRLKFAQRLSECAIAASLGLGKGSVGTYSRRARDAGLSWPLPDGLDDDDLELLLFPASPPVPGPNHPRGLHDGQHAETPTKAAPWLWLVDGKMRKFAQPTSRQPDQWPSNPHVAPRFGVSV